MAGEPGPKRPEARPLRHQPVRPVEEEEGVPADPDQWVAECMNGNNATLIQEKSTLKSGQQGCGPDWNRCLVLGWRAFTTL